MAGQNADIESDGDGFAMPADLTKFDIPALIKTPHNTQLYQANHNLKKLITELVEYQLAHPKHIRPVTRKEIDEEKKVQREIKRREKDISSELGLVRALYRQSVLSVREEKAKTADDRAVNDALILGLHNLKYEEQSLRSEILAAETFDHKYRKLPLIDVKEFLILFPEHQDVSEHDLMIARIEHEHRERVKQEERRQEKLKQKQKLIAEVKKGKEDLTKLDSMVEKFIEAAEPIKKVLSAE